MKAAIYCRLSKEDEDKIGESESIQNQKSMLLQYAIEKGFDIYQIYSDEDYSGIDRNRPAFNSMLQAASEHQFDVVLAKTQSRFTRDMELVEKYLHGKFMEWGIRFIAVVDHVDTNDTANKKSRQINGLINEWYLEDLSTNVRSVLDHKRKEGLFIGSFALYGYCKDPEAKGKLVVDPEAAEIVKRIFSMALSGIGAHKIARILNDEKVPSPTAYKQMNGIHYHIAAKNRNVGLWSSPTVYQMLHNQTYAGNLVQGRHKKISYKTEKTMWLPKSQWIVVENTHEPIIDRQLWDKVQKLLTKKHRDIDLETNKIAKITEDIIDLYKPEPEKVFEKDEIEKLKEVDELNSYIEYDVKRSDIDVNKHMHNLNYLKLAYEALPEEVYYSKEKDNVRIMYKHQILLGDKVKCYYTNIENKDIITIKSKDDSILHAIVELS